MPRSEAAGYAHWRMHAGTGAGSSANSNGHAQEVGHQVDVPAEVLLDGEHVMSDRYAEVTGVSSARTDCLPATVTGAPRALQKVICMAMFWVSGPYG